MMTVKSEFYHVKKLDKESNPRYDGEWFIVEITPLPLIEEIKNVVADLLVENVVSVHSSTRLSHFSRCKSKEHLVDDYIEEIFDELEKVTYKVLIKAPWRINGKDVLEGQPLVIVLDPIINHAKYPEHPHINTYVQEILPSTLCYFEKYSSIKGMSLDKKVVFTVQATAFYLFKHQIWEILKTKDIVTPWIAPDGDSLDEIYMLSVLNPDGICFCGTGKKFRNCCLQRIFKKVNRRDMIADDRFKLSFNWCNHNKFEDDFRTYFLDIFNSVYYL